MSDDAYIAGMVTLWHASDRNSRPSMIITVQRLHPGLMPKFLKLLKIETAIELARELSV